MSTIFLLRHGQADGHEDGDPGLSAVGRAQVDAVGKRLAGSKLDAVWHGPSRRASETAGLLGARLGVAVRPHALLSDRTPVPSSGLRDQYSARRLAWFDEVPETERDEDGRALTAAWDDLCAQTGSGAVMMVTHAFVVSWFVALTLRSGPMSWMHLEPSNAALTTIEVNGPAESVLRSYNEVLAPRP